MFAFADVWEAVARGRGDAPAQVQGVRRLTWSQFDQRADGVASALLETGAGQQANGQGRLSRTVGTGTWQGGGSLGSCAGVWQAERRG